MSTTPFADLLRSMLPLLEALAADHDSEQASGEAAVAESVRLGEIASLPDAGPSRKASLWTACLKRAVARAEDPESDFVDSAVGDAIERLYELARSAAWHALAALDFDRERRMRALATALEVASYAVERGAVDRTAWFPLLALAQQEADIATNA
jgi:hypothetical protein